MFCDEVGLGKNRKGLSDKRKEELLLKEETLKIERAKQLQEMKKSILYTPLSL